MEKLNLYQSLTTHYTMKSYREVEVQRLTFFAQK